MKEAVFMFSLLLVMYCIARLAARVIWVRRRLKVEKEEKCGLIINEFKLGIVPSARIQRVLSDKIRENIARISDLNKDEELYLANEELINKIHSEAIDLENIILYMIFVENGDKTWTVKSQKDMRIHCALMRAGHLDVSPVLTYGEQPQAKPGCRCSDSPILKEDD